MDFLQDALSPGGKFDYPFRGLGLVCEHKESPRCKVLTGVYDVPMPGVDRRSVCVMRMWMGSCDDTPAAPHTNNSTSAPAHGLLIISVAHDAVPASGGNTSQRVLVRESGIVLSPIVGGGTYAMHTLLQCVVQVDLGGSLHQMLKGAYRTGILKPPVRSEFVRLAQLAEEHAGV